MSLKDEQRKGSTLAYICNAFLFMSVELDIYQMWHIPTGIRKENTSVVTDEQRNVHVHVHVRPHTGGSSPPTSFGRVAAVSVHYIYVLRHHERVQ